MSMDNSFVIDDIRLHLKTILESNPRFQRWPRDILEEVEEALATGARGMYVTLISYFYNFLPGLANCSPSWPWFINPWTLQSIRLLLLDLARHVSALNLILKNLIRTQTEIKKAATHLFMWCTLWRCYTLTLNLGFAGPYAKRTSYND